MSNERRTDDVSGPAASQDAASEQPEPDAEEVEGEGIEAPPSNVAELAAACVRFVSMRYGVPLDFTPDTLSLVDQYVKDARAEVAVRPETVALLQGAIGAYLGEVVRRAFGGEWFSEGDESGWRLYLSRVYLSFNPVGMSREALLLEEAEGWHAYVETGEAEREMLDTRLAALPAVADEEYYAPTTRFDVVSIAYHALRAAMQSQGLADVRFTPEDYPR
jgi:hypothetical protein